MKFRTQGEVLSRLEGATRRALRVQEAAYARELAGYWADVVRHVEAHVQREYRQDFRGTRWNGASAVHRGTITRLRGLARQELGTFALSFKNSVDMRLKDLYHAEAARGLWMLDTTTPGHITPALPVTGRRRTREAASPRDYVTTWQEAVDAYMAAWEDAFASGLRLSSLHEGDADNAADVVGATRLGHAAPAAKLDGIFVNAALQTMQDARADLADANPEIVMEEIWQTLEDAQVCPICDGYDGKTLDSVPDDIPAHFFCRCFARLVPRPWAELLRGGDAEAKAAALRMDELGLVPDAMVVRGSRGELVNTFTVKFEQWQKEGPFSLGGISLKGGVK